MRPREEGDVLGAGLPRRAGGSAEDPGGVDARDEDAVEGGVPREEGFEHDRFRRERLSIHARKVPRGAGRLYRNSDIESGAVPSDAISQACVTVNDTFRRSLARLSH